MAETFSLTNPEILVKSRPQSPVKPKIQPIIKEKPKQNTDHKWNQLLQKILFDPKEPNFYQDYLIKPGINFWYAIASCKRQPNNIQVNIPLTYVQVENSQVMIYSDEQGRLVIDQDNYNKYDDLLMMRNQEFVNTVKSAASVRNKQINQNYSLEDLTKILDYKVNPEVPFVIEKGPTSKDWCTSKQVLTYEKHMVRKGNFGQFYVEQQYIYTRNPRHQAVRLVFHTHNNKENKGNYAFLFTNKSDYLEKTQASGLTKRSCICSDETESFEVIKIIGQQLEKYESQAEQLISFLEKNYPIRINEIVLDFINDFHGKTWLTGCRSINLDNCKTMAEYLKEKQHLAEENQNPFDQLTCSVWCKLCGNIFKKDDASKMLTYKLLTEFILHLEKRNIFLQDLKVQHSSTRPCRVCTLCYMLVVSVHELIEVEQKFAQHQAIPIYDPIFRIPNANQVPKSRPALVPAQLYQWRMFFWFTDLQDLQEQPESQDVFHLQYKLNNTVTDFQLITQKRVKRAMSAMRTRRENQQQQQLSEMGSTSRTQRWKKDLEINKMRVHYFFSETDDIGKFLQNGEIQIRYSVNSNWNDFRAEGSSRSISHFINRNQEGQRQSSQVLLFFDNAKYCTLNFYSGLVCDGQYDTSQLNLYKHNNVYFPDDSYYNMNPFPDVWMEILDVTYIERKETIIEGADFYEPVCDDKEMDKMISGDQEKLKNTRYKDVTSRLYTIKNQTEKHIYNNKESEMSEYLNSSRDGAILPKNFNKSLQPSPKQLQSQQYSNKILDALRSRAQSAQRMQRNAEASQSAQKIEQHQLGRESERIPIPRPQSGTQRLRSNTNAQTDSLDPRLLQKNKERENELEERKIFQMYARSNDTSLFSLDEQQPPKDAKAKTYSQKSIKPHHSSKPNFRDASINNIKKVYNYFPEQENKNSLNVIQKQYLPPKPRNRAVTELQMQYLSGNQPAAIQQQQQNFFK